MPKQFDSKAPRGFMSGSPVESFTGGWAKFPFDGSRAHFWRNGKSSGSYTSLCGLIGFVSDKAPALGPGSFPACKICMKKAKRWPNREERRTAWETVPGVKKLFNG